MSIILKGIDMPTDCGHCRFFGRSWVEKNNLWCDLTENHIIYIGEIADFCPLVKIPTPHGDLIDVGKYMYEGQVVVDYDKNDIILEAEEWDEYNN